jgi:hypothetical protein
MPGVETSESELHERLTAILRAMPPLMQVLSVARRLCLPDWLVFSGAVYQPVLNHLTGRPLDYGIKDYDLGYFDDSDLSYEAEDVVIRRVKAAFDEPLRSMVEVRNQARVHLWFEAKFGETYGPLSSAAEALERFASATFAVGVRLESDDRLYIDAPFRVGGQDGCSLKVRIEWCRIGVAGMRITPVSIGLPDFDPCGANRLSRKVQHPPHHIEYLALCSTRPSGKSRQIRVLTQFAERIEGSEYLTGRTQ